MHQSPLMARLDEATQRAARIAASKNILRIALREEGKTRILSETDYELLRLLDGEAK